MNKQKTLKVHPSTVEGVVSGPSLYEMTYVQQLQEELEAFLHSRNFTTIEKIVIGLQGKNYKAYIQAS